jgi:excisionase family DNA binding protein
MAYKHRTVAPDCPAVPVAEFAEKTGTSITLVCRACTNGEIKATKMGSRWVIPRTELDRVLHREPSTLPAPKRRSKAKVITFKKRERKPSKAEARPGDTHAD